LDAALIVNSYHEMPHHAEMLRHLWRALKPGGRLMLMEPFSVSRRSEPRGTQEKAHLIAPEIVEADLREAGFEVVTRIDEFVRGSEGSNLQSLVLGRRPLLH
jgi:predicted methyltransferase